MNDIELKTNLELAISNLEKQDNVAHLAQAVRDALAQLEARGITEAAIYIRENGEVDYNPEYNGRMYDEFYAHPPANFTIAELSNGEKIAYDPMLPSFYPFSYYENTKLQWHSYAQYDKDNNIIDKGKINSDSVFVSTISEQSDSATDNDGIDNFINDLFEKGLHNQGHALSEYISDLREDVKNLFKRLEESANHVHELESKTKRITEQDVREIAKSAVDHYINDETTTLDDWLTDTGRTLLAKLNEHREPDYRAMADARRLDFIVQREAYIGWSRDGEKCAVYARGRDALEETIRFNGNESYRDPRDAIDAAIVKHGAGING